MGGRIKVADFGLVKDLQDVNSSIVGGMTPVYAAPELFDGRPSIHSDQYSLAIVYQEMLTGALPYRRAHHGPAWRPSTCTAGRGWTACRPPTRRRSPGPWPRIPSSGFASCRDMVESLLEVDAQPIAPGAVRGAGGRTVESRAAAARR